MANEILTDSHCVSLPFNAFDNNEMVIDSCQSADVIIDASASISVERYLAIDVQTKARKVSFFLNPMATSTVMLLEDVHSKIRLDLLEMQYYYELLCNRNFENHLDKANDIAYSVSCRDISSKISGDDLALSGAICAKILKNQLQEDTARINIWEHGNNAFTLHEFTADEWVKLENGEWDVYIRKPLLVAMSEQRKSAKPNETGGVLIGCFDCQRKICYIAHQIESPDDSIASPTSYVRGCAGLLPEIERITSITKSNLYYIGEWHSHTNNSTSQSTDDKTLQSVIVDFNKDYCRPACMLILGERAVSVYI
jgi:hypothetical protein